MYVRFAAGLMLATLFLGCTQQPKVTGDPDIGSMVQPVPEDHRMFDPDYHIWSASVVKSDDGRYHMYYARWPLELGHMGWVTDSEIAYAVSEKPEGPYEFVNVALPERGKEYWDGTTTHNPTIICRGDKYYLYYMGTTGHVEVIRPTSMVNPDWWIYRNNQRIGVAVADQPEGPWQRLNRPVLDVSEYPDAYDALMTSNPAVTIGKDGKVVLVYKAVEKGAGYEPADPDNRDPAYEKAKPFRGGKVRFMVAFGDDPLGPFEKHDSAIFEMKGTEKMKMVAEDPFLWYHNNTYYAVVRDNMAIYTGDKGALALLKSEDAIHWETAPKSLVIGSNFEWADGSKSENKLERPQLLIEDGNPRTLFGAYGYTVDGIHRGHAYNVFVPLKQ